MTTSSIKAIRLPDSSDPSAAGIIIPLTPLLLAETADKGILLLEIHKNGVKIELFFVYGRDSEEVKRLVEEKTQEGGKDNPSVSSTNTLQ